MVAVLGVALFQPEDGTAVEAFELHDMESEVESEHQPENDDIHMYSKQLEEREVIIKYRKLHEEKKRG